MIGRGEGRGVWNAERPYLRREGDMSKVACTFTCVAWAQDLPPEHDHHHHHDHGHDHHHHHHGPEHGHADHKCDDHCHEHEAHKCDDHCGHDHGVSEGEEEEEWLTFCLEATAGGKRKGMV